MAIITAKDLSFAYDGRTGLEDVNFSLSAGDYLCVVGENGSGKSTLIKGLLGLKAPERGSIVFGEGLCALISAWLLNSILIASSGTPEDRKAEEPKEEGE